MSDIVELGRNLAAIHDRYRMPDAAEGFTILTDEITRLQAENERLRDALEWYGERARLARLIHSGGDNGRAELAADGGAKARAALEPEGR